jgi:hypothetical protein
MRSSSKADYYRNCRGWITPSPRPDALFCPTCGCVDLNAMIDGYCQQFQLCPECGWNNRPTFKEWQDRLKAEFEAGKFDADPVEKQYVAEMLYCFEHDC